MTEEVTVAAVQNLSHRKRSPLPKGEGFGGPQFPKGVILMLNQEALSLGTNRSVIRELFEYGRARAAVVGAENVFDFSLGNPFIPAPAAVGEALEAILRDTDPLTLHGYTTAVGDYATRQAIADDLNARFDAGAEAEDFFLGCGAAPELTAVLKALAVPGAEVLAIAPYFPEYKPFAENAGLKFRVVPPDVPGFQINLEALSALLTRKSAEFGHPIYLISDEPYRELVYGVETPWIPHIYPNTVVCYSYSKSLSLPGERIGYVYVPKRAQDAPALYAAVAGAARAMGHVCAPSLWQKVIARCAEVRPDLHSYDRNRKLLYGELTAMGYEMAKPDGAFYLFIKAPGGDAVAFSEKAKQQDLLIVPGDGFGCPGWFRICYCLDYDTIRRSLPRFRALIQ